MPPCSGHRLQIPHQQYIARLLQPRADGVLLPPRTPPRLQATGAETPLSSAPTAAPPVPAVAAAAACSADLPASPASTATHDPYQASPSGAVFPSPAGLPNSFGQALAPFRQASLLPTCGEGHAPMQSAPGSHVVGRPPAASARDRTTPVTPKTLGAPRVPIKQVSKACHAKPSLDPGAHARQQLLAEKRACPPAPEGVDEYIASGHADAVRAPSPQSFLIMDDPDAQTDVPPSPEFGKME